MLIQASIRWPWQADLSPHAPLQQRIGLIQIACADKIGLFHIGLHPGKTSKDILAPSLRSIIESPDIKKTGVSIFKADFWRLRKYFDVTPRGAFELSHLHSLITNRAKATTRLIKLSTQVKEHLGLPLAKGSVRTSNWSAPLDSKQIKYAADDVYAGFMLFHCLNAKRAAMEPAPPLPLCAEVYESIQTGLDPKSALRLVSAEGHVSAVSFFQQTVAVEEQPRHAGDDVVVSVDNEKQGGSISGSSTALGQECLASNDAAPTAEDANHLVVVGRRGRQVLLKKRKSPTAIEAQQGGQDSDTQKTCMPAAPNTSGLPEQAQSAQSEVILHPTATKALFDRLSAHRKEVASEKKLPAYIVAHNTMLQAIAQACPRTEYELTQIRGIGKTKVAWYGEAWLAIVEDFLNDIDNNVQLGEDAQSAEPVQTSTLLTTPSRRRRKTTTVTPTSRTKSPSTLHTALSFSMDNVNLTQGEDGAQTMSTKEDSEPSDVSTFGNPGALQSSAPASPKRKRQAIDGQIRQLTTSARRVEEPTLVTLSGATHTAATSIRRLVTQAKTTVPPAGVALRSSSMIACGGGTADDPYTFDSSPDSAEQLQPKLSPSRPTASKQPGPLATSSVFNPAPDIEHVTKPLFKTTQDLIFRNKLLAFNKLVTPAIVLSDATIEFIVRNPPSTPAELMRVPGVMPFANECARKNKCLLTFIQKAVSK